jgi:16S rRNA (guanine1207-N2)-methyltransferase
LEHYFTNNDNLKSELRDIKFNYNEYDFMFKSDNGVFSKNEVDYGSLFLVKTFLSSNNIHNISNILDVGCGYGFIGIVLSKVLGVHVDMIDVNKRAVHLSKMNILSNKVDASSFISDTYFNVDKKYDLIITNPPIRAGKKVVLDILFGGLERLNQNGELWFVIRKDQGALSILKEVSSKYNSMIIEKSKGFLVMMAKNLDYKGK